MELGFLLLVGRRVSLRRYVWTVSLGEEGGGRCDILDILNLRVGNLRSEITI